MYKYVKLMVIVFSMLILIGSAIINKDEDNEEVKKDTLTKDFIVCIDPGHQQKADFKSEPVAPGSQNRKARVSAGTAGIATKKAEYLVNLEAALILKDLLCNNGYNVIMTRESNDVNISNIERAEIANKVKANMTVRIHCDSLNDSTKTGATVLVPSKSSKHTEGIYDESLAYAELLKSNLKGSGIKINGIFERNDITGFNWSQVPVIILEMGFMSNYNEDIALSDLSYQTKLMECVFKSIEEYRLIKVNN